MTQKDVAEKLSTYASFVSKIESGERRIDVVELSTLCRVYGVDFVNFLRSVGLGDKSV
jgi:transcriptional regulator with XRE-family HTH domain